MKTIDYTKIETINDGEKPDDYKFVHAYVVNPKGKITIICYGKRNDLERVSISILSGANYVPDSSERSHYRNYNHHNTPKWAQGVVKELMEIFDRV